MGLSEWGKADWGAVAGSLMPTWTDRGDGQHGLPGGPALSPPCPRERPVGSPHRRATDRATPIPDTDDDA